MCSSDSIDRALPPGAGVPVRLRLAVVLAAAALLLTGCGLATPRPSPPVVLGFVRVSAVRAADDNLLFEAKPRARLWTTNGPPPIEWELSIGSATGVQVPVGSYTLSAFAVYLSDTIDCSDNTNGAPGQTCLQPTLGPSLTCDLPVVVTEGRSIEATFELLAEGRCRLDFGLSSALPDGSPSTSPSAS